MDTLKLNSNWDIELDDVGNITLASGNYATAQNVANACRAFTEDMYFHQADGIPHFLLDISKRPNIALLGARLEKEAKKFPQVSKARFTNTTLINRVLEGELELTTSNNEVLYVTL